MKNDKKNRESAGTVMNQVANLQYANAIISICSQHHHAKWAGKRCANKARTWSFWSSLITIQTFRLTLTHHNNVLTHDLCYYLPGSWLKKHSKRQSQPGIIVTVFQRLDGGLVKRTPNNVSLNLLIFQITPRFMVMDHSTVGFRGSFLSFGWKIQSFPCELFYRWNVSCSVKVNF